MNPLQSKLLEMLTWLSSYLNEKGLTYYVMGGTMLGAVRHQGFIPWDDDVDIIMPREDYEKLIEYLKEPVDHYVVESVFSPEKDFIYNYAKFYDTNTSMTDPAKIPVKRGVFIDVFPLDGIGNTMEESLKNYKKIDFLHGLLAMKNCKFRKGRKPWKNAVAICGWVLPLNRKKLAQKLDKKCAALPYKDCKYVGYLTSTYRTREIMEKEIYGTPTPYQFEGITVYGPEKFDEYLTNLYHDWRKLPPEDKRVSVHDFVEIDLNKPYR
ncbi:MAG: LicD family protein [Clostridia bacterium]|nr:LicD family protein [Clostridia bacterium]